MATNGGKVSKSKTPLDKGMAIWSSDQYGPEFPICLQEDLQTESLSQFSS